MKIEPNEDKETLQQIDKRLKNVEELLSNQKKEYMSNLWILIPVIVLTMVFLVKILR